VRYHRLVARAALVCLVLLTATVEAFDLELDLDAIGQAVAIGQSGLEARRVEFHRPYRLTIGNPPLDYIDVVTPFRRVVLASEARRLAGERLFGQRDAEAALGASPEQVDLRLELTLNPMNTFVGLPTYVVELVSVKDQQILRPRNTESFPRFGPRVGGQVQASPTQGVGLTRGQSQPLLGGTVIAAFDGRILDRAGAYDVVIRGAGTEVRGRVEFSALR